jgi:hypothetical protein
MQEQVKETTELLGFLFDLADATQASIKDDGKITFTDVPKFLAVAWKAPLAFGGIQEVPKELKELDDEGREAIIEFVRRRFDLPNDQLETLIEDTLATGWQFAMTLKALVEYRKPEAA